MCAGWSRASWGSPAVIIWRAEGFGWSRKKSGRSDLAEVRGLAALAVGSAEAGVRRSSGKLRQLVRRRARKEAPLEQTAGGVKAECGAIKVSSRVLLSGSGKLSGQEIRAVQRWGETVKAAR